MKNVRIVCELSDLVSVGPVLVDGVVLVFPGVREVGAPGDQPRLNQLILLERPPTDDCRGQAEHRASKRDVASNHRRAISAAHLSSSSSFATILFLRKRNTQYVVQRISPSRVHCYGTIVWCGEKLLTRHKTMEKQGLGQFPKICSYGLLKSCTLMPQRPILSMAHQKRRDLPGYIVGDLKSARKVMEPIIESSISNSNI